MLSDLTVVFEATFIGLMWLRRARPILCLIGVGMHLSILLAFPIPFFALSLGAMYLLLAPASWFEAAGRVFRRAEPRCVVLYDPHDARWRRLLLTLEHFDCRGNLQFQPIELSDIADDSSGGIRAIVDGREFTGGEALREAMRCHLLFWPFAGLAVVLCARSSESCDSNETPDLADGGLSPRRLAPRPPSDASLTVKLAIAAFCTVMQIALLPKSPFFHPKPASAEFKLHKGWLDELEPFAHAFFGVCSHGVFLDWHFANYDHIVAVTYVDPSGSETWLPLARPSGQVGWYATGRIWAKWAFRANAPYMSIEHLKLGLRDFTAFWAMKNGISLDDARFNVLVKKYDPPTGWQRNFLHNQTQKPWQPAGTVHWQQGQFSAEVVNIEAL
jgi:hypothetical protein